MPRVRIDAVVEEDGSLQVRRSAPLPLTTTSNGVFWTIPITQNEQGGRSWPDVASLEAALVVRGAGEPLERVGSAEPGENGVFTVEEDGDALRIQLFSPHADGEEATFRLSYRLTGAVMAWADTAELYWQFVGPGWEEPSGDVSLTVSFAGAAAPGAQAATDETFRAWGHGPLEGSVEPDAQSATVHYSVPTVRDGEFAEARIVFPASWVPGLVAASGSSTERLPQILEEEAAWAAEANARREQLQTVIGVGSVLQIALPAALLVAAVAFRLTRGRAPQASFDQKYLRELPSNDHPAVIAAFMEGGEAGERAFAVTLMKLTDEGVVGISAEGDGSGRGKSPAYRLRLLKPTRATGRVSTPRRSACSLGAGARSRALRRSARMPSLRPTRSTSLWTTLRAEVAAELARPRALHPARWLPHGGDGGRGGTSCGVVYPGRLHRWCDPACARHWVYAHIGGPHRCGSVPQDHARDGRAPGAVRGVSPVGRGLLEFGREHRCGPPRGPAHARDGNRRGGERRGHRCIWPGLVRQRRMLPSKRSRRPSRRKPLRTVTVASTTHTRSSGGISPGTGHRHSPHESVDSAYESAASSIASSLSASAGGSGGGFSGGGGGGVGGGGGGTF